MALLRGMGYDPEKHTTKPIYNEKRLCPKQVRNSGDATLREQVTIALGPVSLPWTLQISSELTGHPAITLRGTNSGCSTQSLEGYLDSLGRPFPLPPPPSASETRKAKDTSSGDINIGMLDWVPGPLIQSQRKSKMSWARIFLSLFFFFRFA